MTYYDYHTFVHPVPAEYTIPKGTQVRCVDSAPCRVAPCRVDTFLITQCDLPVSASNEVKYYLDYDITKPQLPEKINAVIYNVRALGAAYPVAVYQGSRIWSGFTDNGDRKFVYTPEIESFDTAPPTEEEER